MIVTKAWFLAGFLSADSGAGSLLISARHIHAPGEKEDEGSSHEVVQPYGFVRCGGEEEFVHGAESAVFWLSGTLSDRRS